MSGSDPTVDVEMYVHAAGTSVWEGQTRCIRSVEELAERGVVRVASVDVWPRRVCADGGLAGTSFHENALETIERFGTWAEGAGVDVPFERRHLVSELAHADHEVIDTPAVCLAASDDDDDLLGVYPHGHGSHTCTVGDALARAARDGREGLTCQPDFRSSLASPSVTSTDGA
jgi:hypothetical protein